MAPLHGQPQCHGPFLARGSPAGQGQTPGGRMLRWGRLGFTTHFLSFPPIQPHSKHLAPAPVPSGYKTPLMEGQDGVRGAVGRCRASMAHCPLSLPSRCSAAGEFFPEAAQVAYRMWELSAVKVEVSTPTPAPVPPLCCLPAWDPWLLLSAMGHGQPHASALPLTPQLLSMPFSGFGVQGWQDKTLAGLAAPRGLH